MFVNILQVFALVATVQGAVAKPRNVVDDLQRQAIAALNRVKTDVNKTCTVSKAAVRKDWSVSISMSFN